MNDQSYGVIPFRRATGGPEFLLVCHEGGHWAFPKGHPEAGENPRQTALRELREEAGISASLLGDVPSLEESYSFRKGDVIINKKVGYFLGEVAALEEVGVREGEIASYAWLDYEGALERITHDESRKLLAEARTLLLASGSHS